MRHAYSLIIAFVLFSGCGKDNDSTPLLPPASNSLSIQLKYNVDGQTVIRDSLIYFNEAGNHYTIYNLLYYLSELRLIRQDGSFFQLKQVHYTDCFDPATNLLIFKEIPAGVYTGISFNIGIDSAHNKHGSIPITPDNINMEWPEPMGGGYHFLRLEGSFTEAGSNYGYAMHLGTNDCLIPVALQKQFTVTASSSHIFKLRMNVNEWYRNPHTYDFNTDGNYIMGNLPLMMKVAENGFDVFSIQ